MQGNRPGYCNDNGFSSDRSSGGYREAALRS